LWRRGRAPILKKDHVCVSFVPIGHSVGLASQPWDACLPDPRWLGLRPRGLSFLSPVSPVVVETGPATTAVSIAVVLFVDW
jgi:hypothetical protein